MYSLEKIYERFPIIKEKIERSNDPAIILNTEESVFFNLAQFFKNPKHIQMNLNMLYEHLKDEELLFALEVLVLFFQKDTPLIKEVRQTFYDNSLLNEQLVGGTGFANMVIQEIKETKIRPTTIHTYWQRRSKRLPRADMIIENVPYWKIESVNQFIEEEKKRQSKKNKL